MKNLNNKTHSKIEDELENLKCIFLENYEVEIKIIKIDKNINFYYFFYK